MTPLFAKLNWKDQTEIVVLGAPESFEPELAALKGVTVQRDPSAVENVTFALAFVQTLAEVQSAAKALQPKAQGDAIVWLAYPKGSSKRYRCEFNRDNGWAALQKAGWEPVRMVAIDEDWSGLRFRRVEFIKNMTRNQARPAAKRTPKKKSSR
jgi:hypothetical protein